MEKLNVGTVVISDGIQMWISLAEKSGLRDSANSIILGFVFRHMNFDFGIASAKLVEQNNLRIERGIGDIFSVFNTPVPSDHKIAVFTNMNGDATETIIGFHTEFFDTQSE